MASKIGTREKGEGIERTSNRKKRERVSKNYDEEKVCQKSYQHAVRQRGRQVD